MSVIEAASVLLALGVCELGPCDVADVDERALMLVEACGLGPREKPAGSRCLREAAIIWRLESRFSFYPPARGYGCGPMQVIQTKLRNTRLGTIYTPTCAELRRPAVGVAWGVALLRFKSRFGSWGARSRAYNGHPRHRDAYSRKARRLYGRIRE